MSLDEFLAEYRRRSMESIVALLRASGDVALGDLPDLLAAVPQLQRMTLAELFEGRWPVLTRPAPAPPSAAAKVAAYLLDKATTAGTREGGGILVKVPSYAQIGERIAATPDSVALTVAILERRLITVSSRQVVVRDLRGLALLAGRPLARPNFRHT